MAKGKSEVPMRGNYSEAENVSTETGEIFPVKESSETAAIESDKKADADPFATAKPMQPERYGFHNLETEGKLTGIYLGMGAKITTDNSRGEAFDTGAFYDVEKKRVVLVPWFTALENINDKCEPGKWKVSIEYKGMAKSKVGNNYRDFHVEYGELVTPFTDFDIEEIRSAK